MPINFKLPTTYPVSVVVDGVQHLGDWCVMLGQLKVYFKGRVLSEDMPELNVEFIAAQMLEKLVREHYIPLSEIVHRVPDQMLSAAHKYVNAFDDDQPLADVIDTFGELNLNSVSYKQVAWLAANAVALVVPYWKHMCDGDAPEQIFLRLKQWLIDPASKIDWVSSSVPCIATRDGEVVSDCDACRLGPIAKAVSALSIYLQTANARSAVECLLAVTWAHDEGCYPPDGEDSFEKWLIFEALPHSLKQEPMPDTESN